MCGHVGVAGRITKKEVDIFTDMLYCDALRGMDATGVGRVEFDKSVSIFKQGVPAYDLIDHKQYDKIVSPVNLRMLLGHNRSATVGNKNARSNAHPFYHDGILGAHNGTLPYDSRAKLDNHSDFGTDSEALFFNIAKDGITNTMGKIWGAWALVMYDDTDNTLSFLRNKERTLFYAFSEDKKTILWASEVGLIHWIAGRYGYKIDKPYLLAENKLTTWDIPKNGEEFGEAKTKTVEGRSAPVITGGYYSQGRAYGHQDFYEAWDATASRATDSRFLTQYAFVKLDRKAAIEAFEKHGFEDASDWWGDPIFEKLKIEFEENNDNDPWAWTPDESPGEWAKKVHSLLKSGYDYGERNAKIIDVQTLPVIKPEDDPNLRMENFLSKVGDTIWNPALNRAQVIPAGARKQKRGWWSVKNKMWVYNKALVNYDFTPEQKEYYLKEGFFTTKAKAKQASRPAPVGSVLPFKLTNTPPYKNPETRSIMTKSEFNIITKYGCDWCSKSIDWGDAVRFVKMDSSVECFCEDCAGTEDVAHYMRNGG